MNLPLQQATIGRAYRIVSVEGAAEATQRIRELGLVIGASCRVIRKSPFGGPLEVALNHRRVGLRLSHVDVMVEEVVVDEKHINVYPVGQPVTV